MHVIHTATYLHLYTYIRIYLTTYTHKHTDTNTQTQTQTNTHPVLSRITNITELLYDKYLNHKYSRPNEITLIKHM